MRRYLKWALAALLLAAVVVLIARPGGREPGPGADAPEMALTSPAFAQGQPIPARYTCDGANVSPPLAWSGVPDGTASFALMVDHPDAGVGNFTHWLLCDLPGTVRALSEGVPPRESVTTPARATQGENDFREMGYGGPCPPAGEEHLYIFWLFALDEPLDLPGNFSEHQLIRAMKGHILARGELIGRYARR